MNKIALLLSGGVDSSVALHMLCKAGEKPDCYYIHIGPDKDDTYSCISDEDVERRYVETLNNLKIVLPQCNLAAIYDNTENFRRFAIY